MSLIGMNFETEESVQSVNRLIASFSRELSSRLQAHTRDTFPPDSRKSLRMFHSSEAARFLGVTDGYLRTLSSKQLGPQPVIAPGGRRYYSAESMLELRRYLAENGRNPLKYLPNRGPGEHLQILSVVNFKGGSGKTTVSAHTAQGLALAGYRVLMIDLDPQASLTSMHGYQPEIDIMEGKTLYGAIQYDDPTPLRDIIHKTCFPNLDIVPADLELMEYEHDTPRIVARQGLAGTDGVPFFARISAALEPVADDYDIVIIDCPPQLGYLTLSALCASNAILVTVHPQMLDVMSMNQFLTMTSDLMNVVESAGGSMSYDWFRFVLTRFEPSDSPQRQMDVFLRSIFGDYVLSTPMLKSTAFVDAGITKQSLFEVDRNQFTKTTYDRALESVEGVNREIEQLIHKAWGRNNIDQAREKSAINSVEGLT